MWHSTKRGKSGDDSFIITIMKLTITQKKTSAIDSFLRQIILASASKTLVSF